MKIAVIVILFSILTIAQNTDKQAGEYGDYYNHEVFQATLEAFRVILVEDSTFGADTAYTHIANRYVRFTADTLGYGDSTSIAYFNGQYIKGKFAIRDTLVALTAHELKDSLIFEVKDTVHNAWKSMAVKDLQTGAIISAGTVVVPGNGIWWYEIYDSFPGTVRIRKINNVNGLNGLSGKTPIYFWGNN